MSEYPHMRKNAVTGRVVIEMEGEDTVAGHFNAELDAIPRQDQTADWKSQVYCIQKLEMSYEAGVVTGTLTLDDDRKVTFKASSISDHPAGHISVYEKIIEVVASKLNALALVEVRKDE